MQYFKMYPFHKDCYDLFIITVASEPSEHTWGRLIREAPSSRATTRLKGGSRYFGEKQGKIISTMKKIETGEISLGVLSHGIRCFWVRVFSLLSSAN